MRCRSCDYPLWSIRARLCPECGTPFLPSDFEFAPNSVQFRCPHCAQSYYGTDEHGHLVPRSFSCVRCGQHVSMDEMVLIPTEGVDERQTTAPILPWLDKSKRRTAGLRTIGMAMSQPRRMMDATPVESSAGRAWWFYVLVILLVSILSGFGLVFVGFGAGLGMASRGAAVGAAMGLGLWAGLVFGGVALWGVFAHAVIRLLGPAPAHRLGRTYQALCYSSGAMVPAAIPCLGNYLLPLTLGWWGVSVALALGRAQRVRGVRVWIAAALPAWLAALVMVTIHLTPFLLPLVLMAPMRAGALASMGAMRVQNALVSHATTTGSAPASAVDLLADGSLTAYDLFDPTTQPWSTMGSVGGVPLMQWQALPRTRRQAIAVAVDEALGPDWAAHRVGDMVFTYNGIDVLSPADPGLWVLLLWPDPDSGATLRQGQPISVCRANGSVRQIDLADFAADLAAQNALRAQHALAPLPHPKDVHAIQLDAADAEGDPDGGG